MGGGGAREWGQRGEHEKAHAANAAQSNASSRAVYINIAAEPKQVRKRHTR